MSPHDPLVTLIKTTEGKAKGEREKTLTRQLLEKAPAEDLQGYSAADLHELVAGRLAFLNERKPGRSQDRRHQSGQAFRRCDAHRHPQ